VGSYPDTSVGSYPDMPQVEGVRHNQAMANGVHLHVAEAGDPAAPALMMLHGWPQHWWLWRELIPPLARDYRVICPDLRGFGWSDAPDGAYNPELFTDDISALVDELEIDRLKLVGHDWGALVGFLLALRRPELTDRYLALNMIHPFLRINPRTAGRGLWRLWYQVAMGTPVLSPFFVPRLVGFANERIKAATPNRGVWEDGVLETFTDQMRDHDRARAHSRLYRWGFFGGFLGIALGKYRDQRLRTPTLLLFGREDFAIDESALEGYEPYADDMRVELVPETGHFIVDERPELVLERAREFLG
jgi:pimeloyl-ACP methyl ester carboxylesterase